VIEVLSVVDLDLELRKNREVILQRDINLSVLGGFRWNAESNSLTKASKDKWDSLAYSQIINKQSSSLSLKVVQQHEKDKSGLVIGLIKEGHIDISMKSIKTHSCSINGSGFK